MEAAQKLLVECIKDVGKMIKGTLDEYLFNTKDFLSHNIRIRLSF